MSDCGCRFTEYEKVECSGHAMMRLQSENKKLRAALNNMIGDDMSDLDRLKEVADAAGCTDECNVKCGGVCCDSLRDALDALLAAWEVAGDPLRWIGSPINRWGCRHCRNSSPGLEAEVDHTDDCPYGRALAALRNLLSDPQGSGGGDE